MLKVFFIILWVKSLFSITLLNLRTKHAHMLSCSGLPRNRDLISIGFAYLNNLIKVGKIYPWVNKIK